MKSLKAKIIIMLMTVLVVLTSGLSMLNYIQASKSMQDLGTFLLKNNLKHNMSIAYTYLDKYYGKMAYQNGVLVDNNGKGIAGDTQMVDALSSDAGGVATIFAKSGDDFVRISTNILNDKGERAVGTMLGKSSLAYADVSQGKNYLGQANILNKPYLTSYNPLFDNNGQVIGLLFVGIPQSESAGQIQVYLNQIRNTAILVIIFALLLALLLAYYIGKGISKPIISITSNMQKLASGDLSVQLDEQLKKRKDEIGALTRSLAEIVQSIKGLTDETNALAESTVAGRLEARIDVTQHQGEYRRVVEGINATLDAVIEPINECHAVLDEMAKGSLNAKVTGNYQGDHARMKDDLNTTINFIRNTGNEISEALQKIADGNLDVAIERDYEGDYKPMSSALKNIISSLNEVIGHINQAAEQVASGSEQIADSSQALAQGASEQASATEQLTAAITEIAAQTKQNATNANQASQLALNARDDATQGNEQMKEMLKAMEGINDSSANISKIIKVIDEIAFHQHPCPECRCRGSPCRATWQRICSGR
jgi:methyl-accepting chemotaxis protein